MRLATEKGGQLASGSSLGLKSFFLFLKTDFVFSKKNFLQAGGITEPFLQITRLWKNLFPQAPSAGGSPIRLWKGIGNHLCSGSMY